MCLNNFSDEYNTLMKTVKLIIFEALMFHENTELLPSGESYDLSPGNIELTERITLFLVAIPVINNPFWVEVSK